MNGLISIDRLLQTINSEISCGLYIFNRDEKTQQIDCKKSSINNEKDLLSTFLKTPSKPLIATTFQLCFNTS